MIQEVQFEKQINDFKGLSEHFQNTAQWFGLLVFTTVKSHHDGNYFIFVVKKYVIDITK